MAARNGNRAARQVLLRYRRESPIDAGRADGRPDRGRNVDEGMPIHGAGLDQGDPHRRIFREAAGEHAPRRTRADNHVIEHVPVVTHAFNLLGQPGPATTHWGGTAHRRPPARVHPNGGLRDTLQVIKSAS